MWGNGIEKLGPGRDADGRQFEQEFARDPQAAVDIEGIVQVGVVDEALPPDGGAGLLEVDPHQDEKVVGETVADGLEAIAVFEGGGRVVDRTGAHHHQDAVVVTSQDGLRLLPGAGHQLRRGVGDGQVVGEHRGGDERVDSGDAKVVCSGA